MPPYRFGHISQLSPWKALEQRGEVVVFDDDVVIVVVVAFVDVVVVDVVVVDVVVDVVLVVAVEVVVVVMVMVVISVVVVVMVVARHSRTPGEVVTGINFPGHLVTHWPACINRGILHREHVEPVLSHMQSRHLGWSAHLQVFPVAKSRRCVHVKGTRHSRP